MTLNTNRKRLNDSGPAPKGISGGQFAHEQRGAGTFELQTPIKDRVQQAIDKAVLGIGEGMRPAFNDLIVEVEATESEELFLQLFEHENNTGGYDAFTGSVHHSQLLKKMGYDDIDQFETGGLAVSDATFYEVTPERFDAVNRYVKAVNTGGRTASLHLIEEMDDDQFNSWANGNYADTMAVSQGIRETLRPGYLKDIDTLRAARVNTVRFSDMVLRNEEDPEAIISYVQVHGKDIQPWDITQYRRRGITPKMIHDFGKRACRRFDGADLGSGQLTTQELRSLTHALPKLSYQELVDVKRKVDLKVYPPKALGAYMAFVHAPAAHTVKKSRGDQLIDLVNTRALPEEIEEVASVLTHREVRDHDRMLRIAKIAVQGLGSKPALERYLARSGTGFVNLQYSMLGKLSVVEAGLNNGYKATDMDAYSDSGLSLTDIKDYSPHADFWALGQEHRKEYTALTGKSWHVAEAQWRAEHAGRPSQGGPLG